MEIWSKTILSVYKYLEAISKAIDNIVIKKSVNSAFYNNGRMVDTFESANEIIDLTQRKVNLINLKVLTEKVLLGLEPMQRKVLTLTYIDNISRENVCDLLEISVRTFFRKRTEGILGFVKGLNRMGYDEKKLAQTFEGEKWLINLYNKNSGKIQNCEVYNSYKNEEYKFINNIIRKYDFAVQAT